MIYFGESWTYNILLYYNRENASVPTSAVYLLIRINLAVVVRCTTVYYHCNDVDVRTQWSTTASILAVLYSPPHARDDQTSTASDYYATLRQVCQTQSMDCTESIWRPARENLSKNQTVYVKFVKTSFLICIR